MSSLAGKNPRAMLKLTCLHKSTTHKLEIDASKGVPHLRAELHRLTGVELTIPVRLNGESEEAAQERVTGLRATS